MSLPLFGFIGFRCLDSLNGLNISKAETFGYMNSSSFILFKDEWIIFFLSFCKLGNYCLILLNWVWMGYISFIFTLLFPGHSNKCYHRSPGAHSIEYNLWKWKGKALKQEVNPMGLLTKLSVLHFIEYVIQKSTSINLKAITEALLKMLYLHGNQLIIFTWTSVAGSLKP